jgi:hypothetical protein
MRRIDARLRSSGLNLIQTFAGTKWPALPKHLGNVRVPEAFEPPLMPLGSGRPPDVHCSPAATPVRTRLRRPRSLLRVASGSVAHPTGVVRVDRRGGW